MRLCLNECELMDISDRISKILVKEDTNILFWEWITKIPSRHIMDSIMHNGVPIDICLSKTLNKDKVCHCAKLTYFLIYSTFNQYFVHSS